MVMTIMVIISDNKTLRMLHSLFNSFNIYQVYLNILSIFFLLRFCKRIINIIMFTKF